MKRLMFLATLLCVLCVSAIVQARAPYPEYWNGDRNYPLLAGREGYAWHLDKTSIRAERINNYGLLIVCDDVQIDDVV